MKRGIVNAAYLAGGAELEQIRHGATVEQMTIEVNKAKTKLEMAERDHKQMSKLNKVRVFTPKPTRVLIMTIHRC